MNDLSSKRRPWALAGLLSVPGLISLPAYADDVDGAYFSPTAKAALLAPAPVMLQRQGPAFTIDIPRLEDTTIKQASSAKKPAPLQIAVNRGLPKGLASTPIAERVEWTRTAIGGWGLLIDLYANEAEALRAALSIKSLPAGSTVNFYDGTGQRQDSATNPKQGQLLWSPIVAGDALTLEISLPPGTSPSDAQLSMGPISHFVVSPFDARAMIEFEKNSGACNLDSVCYPDYEGVRLAVSRNTYSTAQGSFTCTGTLLNDLDDDDQRLYYLTANHCINSQAVADTVTTYWYQESAVCDGAQRSPFYTVVSGGAELLGTDDATDTTLLLLRRDINAGVNFAGWSTTFTPGDVVGIHHPRGDEKKISFGTVQGYSPKNSNVDLPSTDPDANYLRTIWNEGTTEPGSSGSALLNENNQVVGTLWAGSAACDVPLGLDRYGRFDRGYQRGNWQAYLFSDDSEKPVTVRKENSALGTISSSPAGLVCDADCGIAVGSFATNSDVTLTATAIDGASFLEWDGDACDSNPSPNVCVVRANTGKVISASFAPDLTQVAEAINDDANEPDLLLSGTGFQWFATNTTSYAGGSAAASADINDSEFSTMSTRLAGPGDLTFFWRVSSEQLYDFLEVYLDGERVDQLSGETGWRPGPTITIPSGMHTVEWTYVKDSSISSGSDRGWVDSVAFSGDDRDGDGTDDDADAFPNDPDESVDNDSDGLGANQEASLGTSDNDADSDDDGFSDFEEVEAGTDPLLASSQPGGGVLRLLLEEPVDGQIHSGVGNLRGWAVAQGSIQRVQIFIDGEYAFDAPYGGRRPDVGGSFPDIANSENSGFSLAFNYGDLSAGEHTVRAVAETVGGETISSQATMNVIRFGTNFISDPNEVDVSTAQCSISNNQLNIVDALIQGVETDLTLQWRTASQGFELIGIQ